MPRVLLHRFSVFLLALASLTVWACAPAAPAPTAPNGAAQPAAKPPLLIGGIPDQSASTLEEIFGLTAKYLSKATGLEVKYAPSTDYAAIVTAFKRGDVKLVWFGGLTGVQGWSQVPGAKAALQRPRDAEFHSVFVVNSEVKAQELKDLKGLTFTFGSESSTSGHLMPRYFMLQAGVDAEKDLKGAVSFSGSHDKTYKLVETGAFQAGALNEAVWQSAVKDGKVDTTKARVMQTSPAYYDYHWATHPDLDKVYGAGTEAKLLKALTDLNAAMGADEKRLLELFATDKFVPTKNENYKAIEDVAAKLGILK